MEKIYKIEKGFAKELGVYKEEYIYDSNPEIGTYHSEIGFNIPTTGDYVTYNTETKEYSFLSVDEERNFNDVLLSHSIDALKLESDGFIKETTYEAYDKECKEFESIQDMEFDLGYVYEGLNCEETNIEERYYLTRQRYFLEKSLEAYGISNVAKTNAERIDNNFPRNISV